MTAVDQRRRQWLVGLGATVAGATLLPDAFGRDGFSFVHITDTHIQPELGAKAGVAKAFRAIQALPEKPDFALIGGDLVMDANSVDRKRCEMLYDEWQEAATQLKMPLYYSIGNHDAFAIGGESKLRADAPDFGKRWWQKRLGLAQRFQSFDHKGWRFVILDSVQIDSEGKWWGEIDSEQMAWLDGLLRKTDRSQPIVVLTHIPVLTAFGQYTEGTTAALSSGTVVKNGKEFTEMIRGRNVKVVLQGHTHVVEECVYLGTRYITGGAICGEWWKGPRLGVHPEGFGVVTVKGEELTYRYIPYGWKAITAPG